MQSVSLFRPKAADDTKKRVIDYVAHIILQDQDTFEDKDSDEISVWDTFEKAVATTQPVGTAGSRAIIEVQWYLEENILPRKEDALRWWRLNKYNYPFLSNVAEEKLCVQALSIMALPQKRKIESEGRLFNSEWTNKYFFIEFEKKYICLICRETVAVAKEYNMRRHFETKHIKISTSDESQRVLELKELQRKLTGEQNIFEKFTRRADTATLVSYKVAREIAATSRPFTDGDFVKKCLLISIESICPDKKQEVENISLSRMTIQRRISDISTDLFEQLKIKATDFAYFSIAIDESTDIKDTAQLLVFIRGITGSFDIFEELANLCPMKGRTTGAEITKEVVASINQLCLPWKKLSGICTDGAPQILEQLL
nr:unnamed protein product [Callosobruchus analis]